MHGPGEPGERDKDADIEVLLLSKEPEGVIDGLELVDERYRNRMARFLKKEFPGLSPQERADIWVKAIGALTDQLLAGKFKAKGNVTGLLCSFIRCDAIDCLRRKMLWRQYLRHAPPATDAIIRIDGPHDLEESLTEIEKYFGTALKNLEQVVLRTYLRLICEGHATQTGRLSLRLLTKEVNRSIGPRRLSSEKVRSLLRKGRGKLRTFLKKKGIFQ